MADTHVCPSCGSHRPASGPPGPCVTCLTRWGSDLPPGHRAGGDTADASGGSGGSGGEQFPAAADHPNPPTARGRYNATRGFDPQANVVGGRSVLATLAEVVGPADVPHVLLHDTEPGPPVARPGSAEVPRRQEPGARFQIVGEIARGGMGAILRGRDVDLGRDLAVKVLLASHRRKPDLVRRFVEEAQISGQLQHPGIIPVYDMGTFADRRPYFTMKLVKGSTLAALLAERPDPGHEQCRLLKVFEQVCQTVAYAHARGVIHRDLKPSNIMVGSFGEVQVMDWGLAKVLEAGGVADDARAARARPAGAPETVIQTLRSGPDGRRPDAESHAGSLMGTPAYMPPEQALGQVEAMDRRSDVFGLGAILCEVLTGTPPYGPGSSEEVVRRALRGDVADGLRRLEACGTDAELVALTRDCLAAEPKDRPRDAGAVAARVTAHLEGVQERLRQAELGKVRAQARAARMKSMVTAAASLLILLIGGGTTAYVLDRQARDRDARFEQTLAVAEGLRGRMVEASRQRLVEPSEWNEVLAAVEGAGRLMPGGAPAALRDRARSLEAAVRADRAAAETDRQLLASLAEVRVARQDLGTEGTDAAFVAALAQAGLDLDRLAPEDAAARLKARPPTVAAELAPFLDALADLRRKQKDPAKGWGHLLAAAQAADPDAYRARLRTLVEAADLKPVLPQLRALARDEHAAALPPASVVLLASALDSAGDETAAADALRRAAAVHPDDLWLNFALAQQSAPAEALRYYTAARAIRPETAHELAHQLEKLGRPDEALPVFKDLVRRVPDDARHLGCYGVALMKAGQRDEGRSTIERAVAMARRRVAERPGESQGYITVGFCLDKAGELAPAAAAYLDGLRNTPAHDAGTYSNLMHTLGQFRDADAAADAYFEALRLRPDRQEAADAVVKLLDDRGRRGEVLALARRALGAERGAARAYGQLGFVMKNARWFEESNAAFGDAARLDLAYHPAHLGIGWNLRDQGDAEGAVAAFREAVRLKPDDAQAHANLGQDLQRLGRDDEAAESLLHALSLGFDEPSAREALFVALQRGGGRMDGVLERARRTFPTQGPHRAAAYRALGHVLTDHGQLEQGILAYQESDRPSAGDLMTLARMGLAHFAAGDLVRAANAYQHVAGGRTDRVPSAQTFVELARQGAAVHGWGAGMLLGDVESNAHREYARGLIQLTFGRSPKAYADTARVAMDRYGQSQQANAVDHVARLFGLAPQSPADAARAVALTERGGAPAEAGDGAPVRHYIAGLAQYRAGNHREAIRRCGESLAHRPPWPAASLNLPVMAMAYHALGEATNAAQWLDRAERGAVNTIDNWHDGVELALLRNEARSLIRGTTPPHELEVVSPAAMTEFYLLRLGRPDRAVGLLRDTIRLRPTDAQAHAHLGVALAAKGERVEAEAAFAEAARVAGDSLAAHVGLADAYARLGHWPRAAAALERADALERGNHWHLYRAAPVYLAAGDTAGYRRTCEALLARFGDDARAELAERVAKTLLLDPGASPDVPAAIRLADRAVTDSDENKWVWYFQLAKALAEYRAGRDAAAVEWVRRMPEWRENACGTVVREAIAAMAHHRLGRAPEARAALATARLRAMDGPSLALHRPYAVDCHDWLIAELFLREAETLLSNASR